MKLEITENDMQNLCLRMRAGAVRSYIALGCPHLPSMTERDSNTSKAKRKKRGQTLVWTD
jgi:predicted aconitase